MFVSLRFLKAEFPYEFKKKYNHENIKKQFYKKNHMNIIVLLYIKKTEYFKMSCLLIS